MHETTTDTPSSRHLHAVPDEATEVPTGLVWHSESLEDQDKDRPGEEPAAGRVMETAETDTSLTPSQVDRAQISDRLKVSLEAAHTYALLCWNRRWEVAMDYVMDPALRQQMLDTAEEDLDNKIADAQKTLRRSIKPEDTARANKKLDRLKRREISELEVDARVLRARTARLAGRCVIPAAVLVGPVLLAASGMWAGLLAWPAAWGWLSIQGRAMARAEVKTTVTETTPTPSRIETRARQLAEASAETGGGAAATTTVVGATDAENAILRRLSTWTEQAKERGLDGLEPGDPTVDEMGIAFALALGKKWTPGRVRGVTGQIRALLAVPEDAGVQVSPGTTGEQVVVRLRTRTPDLDTAWNPDRVGVGFVPESGRIVNLDAYGHRVVAGVTGSGKSTAMRPWMASVVLNPLAALVFIDPKGQEAGLWEHCARTVKGVGPGGQAAVYRLLCELEAELIWRQENAGGTNWTPTEEHPELVIVIDEGASLVRMAKNKKYKDVLDKAEFLASQGRAGLMWVHWATQYPTKADGIPAQVTENIINRLCLAVDGPQADRVVFGENATANGWTPSELDMPGWSLVRTGPRDTPEHVANWHMTDEQVQALPEAPIWHSKVAPQDELAEFAEDEGLDQDQEDDEVDDWIGAQGAVMAALKNGPRTLAQLVEETKYSKTMVHNALTQLRASSRIGQVGGRGSAWRAL